MANIYYSSSNKMCQRRETNYIIMQLGKIKKLNLRVKEKLNTNIPKEKYKQLERDTGLSMIWKYVDYVYQIDNKR